MVEKKSIILEKSGIKKESAHERERVSVYIEKEIKKNWREFAKIHNISTVSKLIRESVNYFIKKKKRISDDDFTISDYQTNLDVSHEIKERLTIINGNLQLIIKTYKAQLDGEIIGIIKEIIYESKKLEQNIIPKLIHHPLKIAEYDVLIIEDDVPTINLLNKYFLTKRYKSKGILTGAKAIEELRINYPKLIILDVMLPDINGFDICKMIKKDERYKDIPVFYLSAVSKEIIEEKVKETKANGYILKPFDLLDLDLVFETVEK